MSAVRPLRRRRPRRRDECGSAVAEFALTAIVLLPLFFAILQLAFIWHVRSTATSAASEGARYAAAFDRDARDGEQATAAAIDDALGSHVSDTEHAAEEVVDGQRLIVMTVRVKVPTIAFWGPSITLEVTGHAVKETLP